MTYPTRSPAALAPQTSPRRGSSCSTFHVPATFVQRTAAADPLGKARPPTMVPSPFTAWPRPPVAPGSNGSLSQVPPGRHRSDPLPTRTCPSALIASTIDRAAFGQSRTRGALVAVDQSRACEGVELKSSPAISPRLVTPLAVVRIALGGGGNTVTAHDPSPCCVHWTACG